MNIKLLYAFPLPQCLTKKIKDGLHVAAKAQLYGVCVCEHMHTPAHDVKLAEELVHSGVVVVTLGSYQIQSSAVL